MFNYMNKKTNIFLIVLVTVVMALGLLIFILPTESQGAINSWFENIGSPSIGNPDQSSLNLKVTGPASSGSNFSQ
jgi:hypothetical protein